MVAGGGRQSFWHVVAAAESFSGTMARQGSGSRLPQARSHLFKSSLTRHFEPLVAPVKQLVHLESLSAPLAGGRDLRRVDFLPDASELFVFLCEKLSDASTDRTSGDAACKGARTWNDGAGCSAQRAAGDSPSNSQGGYYRRAIVCELT
jgi:hypothetical protein